MQVNYRRWSLVPLALALGLWTAACSDQPTASNEPALPPLLGELDPANDFGACMGNDVLSYNALVPPSQKSSWSNTPEPNGNYCTAKDIYLASAVVTHVVEEGVPVPVAPGALINCNEGETFQVIVNAQLGQQAASARTDIGVWIAQAADPANMPAPTNAVAGTCNHYNLVNGTSQVVDLDGDQCGDMNSAAGELTDLNLGVLTLKCEPNENDRVEVPSCIGWTVPGGDRACPFPGGVSGGAINYRMGTVPVNTSKCNCEAFELNIVVNKSAFLEVRKEIDPTTDPGLFNLYIDAGTGDEVAAADQGHNGTTGKQTVSAGTSVSPGAVHTFSETAGTGTTQTHYTTEWECRDRGGVEGDRGTGTSLGPNNITLQPDDDVVCTFTNTLIPATLTLVKTVINDDGGTATAADFQAYINGGAVDWEDPQTLAPGNYTASEDVVTGYTPSAWGGDCAADGTITLAPGDDKTCTITNDDNPATLTLVKTVVNDDGGDATEDDFQAYIDGNAVPWGAAQSVGAGNFVASEDELTGYTASSWSGDCDADGNVTLALGDNKTCYITNDDQPAYLILEKTVINDDGGDATEDDFQAYIGALAVDWDASNKVLPGNHTASEDELPGYTASVWGGDCAADGSVTIALGETKTCTITNDDQPAYLILEKTVINDDGGTATQDDFQAYIDGGAVDWDASNKVDPGMHTASEDVVAGYTAGVWGGDCAADGSVTLALGETKTCTITNDDDPQEVMEETAFALGDPSMCFIESGFSRWGWTIGPIGAGTYEFDVYAGAADCDTNKGTFVGTVTIEYDGATLTYDLDLEPGFTLVSEHVYAGSAPYPLDKNGNPTVAPGQYSIQSPLGGNIYVIYHAVVGVPSP